MFNSPTFQIEEGLNEINDYYINDNFSPDDFIYNENEIEQGLNKSRYLQSLEQLRRSISRDQNNDSPNSVQKILDENINSLQNSISLFYNMHKSQVDDINRVAEEYYFALNQLIRQNELIIQNENKVQTELASIESIHSQLMKTAASLHDSQKSIEMNKTEELPFLLNQYIIKYEKKCQKILFKTRDIKNRLKNLKNQSIQNKKQIQFLKQKQIYLNTQLDGISNEVSQIIEFKNGHFNKLELLKRTNQLISEINLLIIKNKENKEKLKINEQFLLQKLNQIEQKELILKQETVEINKVQKLIEEKREDIKRTLMIKDDVEKPLLLVYNEIKDNIQEELQKELTLSQKLNFLNTNRNFCYLNQKYFYDEFQINSMKKQLLDLNNDCSLLRDEIINQSNKKLKLLNQLNSLQNEKNLKMDVIYKLNTNHNGNVAVLYDYAMNRSDLDYIRKLQIQIRDKRENLKSRKEKYLKKFDALILVLENFIKKDHYD